MSETRRSYETTYIVNASIEDSQIESTVSHNSEVIERNGGTITATNRWGRKRMAYAIEKKNNGYYVNVEFDGPGQLIPQLERVYLLDENILRFLTIALDKRALQARAKNAADTAAAAASEAPRTEKPEAPRTEKSEPQPAEPRAPIFTEEKK